VLVVSDRMRDAVLRGAGGNELKDIAVLDGMITMREAGIRKALEGDTTLEEACRVLLEESGEHVELKKAA
jgi:type II secretory ATPase GspE/PulE/Tfp pilus assembly ATPase PilB-like protein